jgi:hypothetical protein
MKVSGEQVDDRIVEVHWDFEISHWRMMRFRDDKPNGNHKNVVTNIVQSIADGVEKDAVCFSFLFLPTAVCCAPSDLFIYFYTVIGSFHCHPQRVEGSTRSISTTAISATAPATVSTAGAAPSSG